MSAAVLDARQPDASEAPVTLSELRSRFRDRKAELLEQFRVSRPTAPAAMRLIRSLCRHVDDTLLTLWQHTGMPDHAALLADAA